MNSINFKNSQDTEFYRDLVQEHLESISIALDELNEESLVPRRRELHQTEIKKRLIALEVLGEIGLTWIQWWIEEFQKWEDFEEEQHAQKVLSYLQRNREPLLVGINQDVTTFS